MNIITNRNKRNNNMKKSILSLMALAIAGLAFTSCDDVPMPYNQPNVKPGTEVTPQGTGTAADPYNVAAALQVVNALGADETTETALYVKGKVTGTPTIETEKYGNANYYITDDGSNKIYIFQSYYLGNRKFTADDKLNDGDEVIVCGKFTNYKGNTPETVGKGSSYIYSLNGKTEGGGDTPTPGEAKGDGTQANPYNAAGANQAASALADGASIENVYVSGIISEVGSFNEKYGELNYYISDDGTKNGAQFYVYNGYGKDGAKFTSANDLKVGQKVTVVGKLINYMGNTPEFQYGSKIVSIDGSDTPQEKTGLSESFSASQGDFTIEDISLAEGLTYVWKWNNSKYMKASAYKQKNLAAQSRLISPAFSLKGISKPTLTFDHTGKYFSSDMKNDIKVQASTDGKTWQDLTISAYPAGNDWTFVTATADLSAFAGQSKVYIAFLYTSTADAAATWEVKNVEVK